MSKSVYFVFIFGALGAMMLMMAMCQSFEMTSTSDQTLRRKLATGLRNHFKFESAGVEIKQEGDRKQMSIAYATQPAAPLGDLLEQTEILQVAHYAYTRYEGTDRQYIREIHVTRTEKRMTDEGPLPYVLTRILTSPPPRVDLQPVGQQPAEEMREPEPPKDP